MNYLPLICIDPAPRCVCQPVRHECTIRVLTLSCATIPRPARQCLSNLRLFRAPNTLPPDGNDDSQIEDELAFVPTPMFQILVDDACAIETVWEPFPTLKLFRVLQI